MSPVTEIVLSPAAVRPSARVPFTALDSEQRLELYRSAFSEWAELVQQSGGKLCVIETTGQPRDSVLGSDAHDVEYVHHTPDAALEPLGKGALESSALDAGMSYLADKYGPDITVHKVTGKLRVPNWSKVLLPLGSRGLRIRRSLDRGTCDTRVFTTTPAVWQQYFTGIHSETNDPEGRYFEHVVGHRSILAEYASSEFEVLQFPTPPRIVGISGSDGKAYGGFNKDGLSNSLAHVEQYLLPPFRRRMI